MPDVMMAAAEARWREWHAGRQMAMLGLSVIGIFAALMTLFR